MTKYIGFLILVSATLGFSVKECWRLPCGSQLDLMEILVADQKMREKVAFHKQFSEVLETAVMYLGKGDIHLKEASIEVSHASQFFSPTYLQLVPRSDPGITTRVSVGRNLLGHLRDRAKQIPEYRAQIPIVERELEEMIAQAE